DEAVVDYLERCYPGVRADAATVERLLAGIADLDLSNDEVLQLINMAPTDMMYLYGLWEDCDQRFSEEQLERVCELVKRHLPLPSLQTAPETAAAEATEASEATEAAEETAAGGEKRQLESSTGTPQSKKQKV
ncbi:unnamed protein product, partial [Effrenium voratum]